MSLLREWTAKHKVAILVSFVLLGIVGMGATITKSVKSAKEIAESNARLADSLRQLDNTTKETSRIAILNTKLQERLLASSFVIKSLAKQNIDTVTGGDSYCYALVKGNDLVFVHKGSYPLYNVAATMFDISEDRRVRNKKAVSFEDVYSSGEYIAIGDLGTDTSTKRPVPESLIKLRNLDSSIYYIARNGSWAQRIRRRYVKDKWLTATQVFRFMPPKGDLKKLFESVDPGYPADNNGKINWD